MRRYSVPLLVLVTLSLRCSRYEEPQDDCVGGRCDIWGADDRHEPYEASSAFPTELFHAAGALVRKRNVEWDGRRDARMLWDFPLSLSRGVCSDENYADQPAPASCSGFFVGGDVFVTAAHCLSTKSKEAAKKSCEDLYVVFDYGYFEPPKDPVEALRTINEDSIFKCSKVLLWEHQRKTPMKDIAIIALDGRPAREPMQVSRKTELVAGDRVMTIGYPLGLPLKVTQNGVVKSVRGPELSEQAEPGFFFADLDVFGGNSGGAVINPRSRLVEGLIATGSGPDDTYDDADWIDEVARFLSVSAGCRRYNICDGDLECKYYTWIARLDEYADRIDELVASRENSAVIFSR